eukprot:2388019-Lingulodinium_polyedra.AAC.1
MELLPPPGARWGPRTTTPWATTEMGTPRPDSARSAGIPSMQKGPVSRYTNGRDAGAHCVGIVSKPCAEARS